ncbi:MAG TPA: PPC domain-containing DNA-binding protein [candidate division Zixibacteria bacterium]|jgi:predicted DNA-binding protein with PD1-like motif
MYFRRTSSGYVIRLKKGEEIHASLTRFMKAMDIGAGSVTGLGAVTKVALGYFHADTREYDRFEYNDEYELVSLTGNLSYDDGNPRLHAHVVISGPDMKAISGHLFEASIAVTGEFYLTFVDQRIDRVYDDETGLKLLNLPETL